MVSDDAVVFFSVRRTSKLRLIANFGDKITELAPEANKPLSFHSRIDILDSFNLLTTVASNSALIPARIKAFKGFNNSFPAYSAFRRRDF